MQWYTWLNSLIFQLENQATSFESHPGTSHRIIIIGTMECNYEKNKKKLLLIQIETEATNNRSKKTHVPDNIDIIDLKNRSGLAESFRLVFQNSPNKDNFITQKKSHLTHL